MPESLFNSLEPLFLPGDGTRELLDDTPLTVDEEGFRDSSKPVGAKDGIVSIPDLGVRRFRLLQESERLGDEVLYIDTKHHHPAIPVPPPGGFEQWGLLAARDTPRGPEIEDHDLSTQRGQIETPFGIEPREDEPWSLVSTLLRRAHLPSRNPSSRSSSIALDSSLPFPMHDNITLCRVLRQVCALNVST